MAKQVAPNNIAFTVDAGSVKPDIKSINDALKTISATPLEKLRDTSEKATLGINKSIANTVQNIAKLKRELANTGGVSDRLLNATRKQYEQLEKLGDRVDKKTLDTIGSQLDGVGGRKKGGGGAGAGGSRLAGLADTADQIFGGKFDVGKGAKLGIAGIVGGLVADTLSDVTNNLVKAKDNGGGFGDYTKAVGDSLPIIDGIVKTVENIDELWSGVRAETEGYKAANESANAVIKAGNKLAEDRKKILADSARSIADQVASFEASLRGGKVGAATSIQVGLQSSLGAAAAQKDAQLEALKKERLAANAPLLEAQSKAKTPALKADYQNQINKTNDAFSLQASALTKTYEDQIDVLEYQAEIKRRIALGEIADTKAIDDSIYGLAKTTRGLSADPIESMALAFAELKPSAEDLADFNAQLGLYKQRLKDVEKEQKKLDATKTAERLIENGPNDDKLIGLNSIDRQITEMSLAGVNDEQGLLSKVELQLNTTEALKRADELKKALQTAASNIKVTLASGTKEKIAAQIEAENAARLAETGQGFTAAEKAQLQTTREDVAYASEAAQTKEGAKSPQEKLNESIDSLKEQFARNFINEQQLNSGIGNSLNGFADSQRTSRPDLIEADSARAQQMLAVGTGQAIDASKPELMLAKEGNKIAAEIRDAIKENRGVRVKL